MGFVTEVTPVGSVQGRAGEIAVGLARLDSEALSLCKRAVNLGSDLSMPQALFLEQALSARLVAYHAITH